MAENKTPVTMKVKDFAEREVLLVNYDFSQETDREGQVSGIPRGGRLKIRVKALNDGNPELLGWMLSPNDPRDVEVAFENTVDGKAMKSLKGTGCYCVHYKEYWGDGEEHYEEVTIRKCLEIKSTLSAPKGRRLTASGFFLFRLNLQPPFASKRKT